MRPVQRQALYLQYTTKTTGLSTCTAAEKANDKKRSDAVAKQYVNQNNHCGKKAQREHDKGNDCKKQAKNHQPA